jgi:HSP20 family molecular chaperone IbpA
MNDSTEVAKRDPNALAEREEDRSTPTMTLHPAVDIIEDRSGVTLWADLPGVTKDKLEVNVHDGNLKIEAEAVVPMPPGLRVQHAEIRQPLRAGVLAESDLDAAKIEANLQDGVEKLAIPRRGEARPRRIEVTVA